MFAIIRRTPSKNILFNNEKSVVRENKALKRIVKKKFNLKKIMESILPASNNEFFIAEIFVNG
jgi:hypothetical protein